MDGLFLRSVQDKGMFHLPGISPRVDGHLQIHSLPSPDLSEPDSELTLPKSHSVASKERGPRSASIMHKKVSISLILSQIYKKRRCLMSNRFIIFVC